MLLLLLAPTASAATVPEQVEAVARWRADRFAQDAPAIDPSVYARVATGQIVTGIERVPGVAAAKGWVVGILDQGVERVWMALNSEDHAAGRYGLSISTVLQGDARRSGRLVFQLMPLPIVTDRWWMVREQMNGRLYTESGGRLWELASTDATDPEHLRGTSWASVAADAQPVAWTRSAWLLLPLQDGRTLGEFYSWTDPGGALPAGLASRFAAGTLKGTILDTQAFAASLAHTSTRGFVRPDGAPL